MEGETLDPLRAVEVRRGVGRMKEGARELLVIAVLMPVFLVGLELAAEGISAGGFVDRTGAERQMDRALFAAYGFALIALAVRARWGAARAVSLLPALLAADRVTREEARARLLRLGGPAAVRRLTERVRGRALPLLAALGAASTIAWAWAPWPMPNPLWLTIFAATTVGMDLRWRALVADVADQLPVTVH